MADVTPNRILRFAGWSAYVCAALSFLSGVFLLLFFLNIPVPGPSVTVGSSPLDFGLLNDYSGLVANAFMLPLPLALSLDARHRLTRQREHVLNGIALVIGILGVLTLLSAQALLVTGVMSFDVNLTFSMLGLALLGAWLLLANALGRSGAYLARWQAWLGGLTGALFISAAGFLALSKPFDVLEGGTLALQPPLLMGTLIVLAGLGALAYLVTYPLWLLGLGHQFLLASPATSATPPVRVARAQQARRVRQVH